MIKKLLFAIAILLVAVASKADDHKIDSKVQKVTVFLNGAQVTRTAMVNVTAGTSTLIFGNISPGIDVQSIQVHANGEFTILSVKHEMNYLDEQAKVKHGIGAQGRGRRRSRMMYQYEERLHFHLRRRSRDAAQEPGDQRRKYQSRHCKIETSARFSDRSTDRNKE